MSLSSLSIFKDKFTKTTPPSIAIPMLTDLRLKMNYKFYIKLPAVDKEKVLKFLFSTLHDIWHDGPSELRVHVASTIGHILINLGPFINDDLMKSFISETRNYKSTSILYFSCFTYLSKFYSPNKIEIIAKNLNIFNLISINDASSLPRITKELFGLPNQMLHSLVKQYIAFLKEDPNNKYIIKSAQIIISRNPDFFIDLIKKDIPLEIIMDIFSDKLPNVDDELVKFLSNSALQSIQDFGTPLKRFSASCKLLNSLIRNNQVSPSIVHGIFTKETMSKVVSLEDLLLLPIEPDIVFSIYGSQNVKTNLLSTGNTIVGSEDSQIIPDLNSNPNISGIFDSNNFDFGDGFDQAESVSLLVDDGTVQVALPGAPIQDISFLPSLPLPDFAENVNEESVLSSNNEITSEKHSEKVASNQDATKFDQESPKDIQMVLKSSSFADLSALPPPSIPSILGGQDMKRQSNLFTSDKENYTPNNKKTSFGSPPYLNETPTKKNSQRLSLDFYHISPHSEQQSKSSRIQFQRENKSIFLLRLNPKFASPLINYFKRFPEYRKEFLNLILYSISLYKSKTLLKFNSFQTIDSTEQVSIQTSKTDAIYSVLKAVSETHSTFQPTELNSILEKIFELVEANTEDDTKQAKNSIDITLQTKILDLIGTLNVDRLTKKIANKMFNFIDTTSISKVEILRKKSKKSFTSLTNHTSTDLFKFFFDIYIQKLDIFNTKEFQNRLSFISYVMTHIPSQFPISFSSITTFFYEALMLNNSLHRNIMLDMFRILSVLAPTTSNPQMLVVFIQHAINIIQKNCTDYTGIPPFLIDQKVPFFFNNYQVENTAVQLDTDPTSNPSIWHRKYLKCAHIAYSFLATVPWDRFEMTANDKHLIEVLVEKMSLLLPKESSMFLLLLRDSKLISTGSLDKIIMTLNIVSRRKKDLIAFLPLYRFICKKNEKYKQLKTKSLVETLLNILPRLNDINHDQAISIKLFLAEKRIDAFDTKKFQKILIASTISTSSSEILHLEDIKNDGIEEDDDDENDKYESFDKMLNDQELSSFIVSLTPLIYANLDVPAEFLQPFHIQNFCANSNAAIDEDQCKQLFEYALSNSSQRVLCSIIRYSQKMHYHLNIEENLGNPIFNSKKLFSYVFTSITYKKKGFNSISQRCNNYIKQFYPNGFFSYVLNATEFQRPNAIRLIQFDPSYFINQYLEMSRFTANQLINICIYIQNVKFPREPIFRFIIGLLSQTSKTPSQLYLVHRIMTIFVSCYGLCIKRAPKQVYDIIACELGYPLKINQKLKAAELVEFIYSLNAISRYMDCQPLLDELAKLFTKNTTYYYYIVSLMNKNGTVSTITDCQKAILPSIRILNVFLASKFLRNNPSFNVSTDFINNVMKLLDPFVPLPYIGPGNNKVINDDYANCFFCFAMCVLTHELQSSVQKLLYNLMYERMPFEISSFSLGRFNSLFKSFTNQQHLKSDLNNDIFQKCCSIIDETRSITPFFIDLFSSVAKSVSKQKIFNEKMVDFMKNKISYDSPSICELASTELMKTISNKNEADDILPFEIPDFYIFFLAISSIEKKNRSMVHDKLQKRYKGTHLLALKLLKDPKFRIFSPLVALISNDSEIPPKLKNYLDSISDKIQRIYSTDAYHEF